APPIAAEALHAAGGAVHRHETLLVEILELDGTRPEPGAPGFVPARRLEPHHLVLWAGRWYLVGFDHAETEWRVHRLDRLRLHPPTGIRFTPRVVPGGDVAHLVMSTYDRGDTLAAWQCTGSAVVD